METGHQIILQDLAEYKQIDTTWEKYSVAFIWMVIRKDFMHRLKIQAHLENWANKSERYHLKELLSSFYLLHLSFSFIDSIVRIS